MNENRIRASLFEMEEGFLPFAGPRKLSVQEKNVLKIRSLEKEKKDSLEVKSCELTESCLGVGCVITCPALQGVLHPT